MKKLLSLFLGLLIATQTFAQLNITLSPDEVKVLQTGAYNITGAPGAKIVTNGDVMIFNLNQFYAMTLDNQAGTLKVFSSLNANGLNKIIVSGRVESKNIELQGGFNTLLVYGHLKVDGDIQVLGNNQTFVDNYGKIEVSNYLQLNNNREGAYTSHGCAEFYGKISQNSNNGIDGSGTLYLTDAILNQRFTNSEKIFVKTTGFTVNNPKQWGKAQVNSGVTCEVALPVTIIQSYFYIEEGSGRVAYELEMSQDSNPKSFSVQVSDDGVNWKTVLKDVSVNGTRKLKGYVPNE